MKLDKHYKAIGLIAIQMVSLFVLAPLMAQSLSVYITANGTTASQEIGSGSASTFDLDCTPQGGCTPYTYSWSFTNAEGGDQTAKHAGSVTFTATGVATIMVTDASGANASATLNVIIPRILVPLPTATTQIWWLAGLPNDVNSSGANYQTTAQFQVDPTSLGGVTGLSFTWAATAGASEVSLVPSADTLSVTATSASYSTTPNDITLELQYNGSAVDQAEFDIDAPLTVSLVGPGYIDRGVTNTYYWYLLSYWSTMETDYGMQLHDSEAKNSCAFMDAGETFDPVEDLYTDQNWRSGTITIGGHVLDVNGQWGDTYSVSGWLDPLPVAGGSTGVFSEEQHYWAGSGSGGEGMQVANHNLIFYTGYARQIP